MDPQDELVEVADEAGGRPERDPDEDREDEPDGEGAGDPDPPSGGGRDVGSLELDQHRLTAFVHGTIIPARRQRRKRFLGTAGRGRRYAGCVDQYRSAEPPQPPSSAIFRALGADLAGHLLRSR